MFAVLKGHTEIVRYLFDNGADEDMKYPGYGTVLKIAKIKDHDDIVKLLTETK